MEKAFAVIRKINTKSTGSIAADYKSSVTGKTCKIVADTGIVKEGNTLNLLKDDPQILFFDDKNSFEYKITCRDTRVSEYVSETEKVINFWKQHPKVVNVRNKANTKKGIPEWDAKFYNPNINGDATYIIEVFDEVEQEDVSRFKNQMKVVSRYYSFPSSLKRSVAYYFGVNPTGMSDNALDIKMIGIDEKGILLAEDKTTNESNIEKFLRTFEKEGTMSFDVEVEILAHKLISASKITEKGGLYYQGLDVIASSFDALVLYLKENEKVRKALESQVAETDEEEGTKVATRGRKAKETAETV